MNRLALQLRKGLVTILGRSGFLHQCEKYLVERRIEYCHQNSESKEASFSAKAKVHNWCGRSSKIQVGKDTQICGDLLVFPSGGQITLGQGCFLGENSRIWSMERVTIGDHVLISHCTALMDTDSHEVDFEERAVNGLKMLTKGLPTERGNIRTAPITIGDHVWIGLGSIILKGVTIGEKSIVAAGSVVTKSIPPLSLVAGNPARVIRQLEGVEGEGS